MKNIITELSLDCATLNMECNYNNQYSVKRISGFYVIMKDHKEIFKSTKPDVCSEFLRGVNT